MKVVALILAKSESKRLPNKNTLDFHGLPMFLVNVNKCLNLFDEVYVSSDSESILNDAKEAGAIPILRPKELCGDVPNISVYQHALKNIDADSFVAVQANSPTVKEQVIQRAKNYLEEGGTEVITCWSGTLDNPIYGSVWGMTRDRLFSYKNPYKPEAEFMIEDNSVDIHTLEDYNKALNE